MSSPRRQFPRRQFAVIANIDTDVLKTLQRRDQVPLFRRRKNVEGSAADERDIAEFYGKRDEIGYTAFDAVMLATADRLTLETAFSRDAAKDLVEAWWHSLAKVVRLVEAGEEVWIGAYSEGEAEEAESLAVDSKISSRTFDLAIGSPSEIVKQIEANFAQVGSEGRAICLINMKPIILRAKATAAAYGFTGSLVD